MTARRADDLVEVRILGMPVAGYQRACQYDEELLRELMLAASRPPGPGCLPPAGLTALVDELGQGFPQYTDAPQADVEAARARGAETVDLALLVGAEVGARVASFLDSLACAEDLCRQGDLLTLAAPPDVVELREWYLGQIVDQIEGRAPTAWAERSSVTESS